MSDTEKPRHFRIDVAPLPSAEAVALARHFLGPGYEISPLDDGRFSGAADFWLLDGFTAVHNQHIAGRVFRLEDQPTEFIRIRLVTKGRMHGTIDGEVIDAGPGSISLDGNHAMLNVDFEDFECLVVKLPAAAVGYDTTVNRRFVKLEADDPQAILLATAFETFFTKIRSADAETAERMARSVRGLIGGFVASLPPAEGHGGRARRRLAAMCAFLEKNMADPALGVDDLVREFHTSRAAVYRRFRSHGGVKKFLTERRLRRAMALLAAKPQMRVSAVAKAVGYADRRVFSRAFSQRFGISPRDVWAALGSALENPPDGPGQAERIGEHYRKLLNRTEGE